MISATEPVFPNNAAILISDTIKMLDPDLRVFMRPLRTSDPVQSVAVLPVQVTPDEDTTEIIGIASAPPPVSQYVIGIQAFVKDMDEEKGLATHSVLSKMIRSMLDRDATLRVGLRSLFVEDPYGGTERALRWGVRTQRFMSNELDGAFLHLSTLEFWLETETH